MPELKQTACQSAGDALYGNIIALQHLYRNKITKTVKFLP
jgi:hypothetical protein